MLKMKQGIHWVDLPQEMQPAIPPAGTTVEYRFTDKFIDYQPGGIKRTQYRHEVALPSMFTIRHDNKVITVGLVGGYDERGNPNPGEIRPLTFKPNENGGRLYLHPDDDNDLATFVALELHPEVGANSNKDAINTPKVMEKVDSAAEANKRIADRAAKRKATNLATGLKGDELNRAALLLGISTDHRESSVVQDDIEAQAEANPASFIQKLEDKDADIKAEFTKGLNLPTIFIDGAASQLKWVDNKGALLTLARTDKENARDEFANFVNNEDNGKIIFKQLVSLNKAKALAVARLADK